MGGARSGKGIAVPMLLSVILTVSVIFPDASNEQMILGILGGGSSAAVIVALAIIAGGPDGGRAPVSQFEISTRSRSRKRKVFQWLTPDAGAAL